MPGPTQTGARTGSMKYQAGHGFRRGQPVYLQSPGQYALATLSTGFDGLVGDIRLQQFELVTAGQLDVLSGLVPNVVYSLSSTPGQLAPGSLYPVFKALSADTAALVTANTGTSGTDVVLPYTFSLTAITGAVPLGGASGALDPSWIPALNYDPVNTAVDLLAAHEAAFDAHAYYVRNPEGGGVLDTDEGSLVFDVDSLTQVVDGAYL